MEKSSPPSSSEGRSSSVFDRLHDGVKRWVWEQNWTTLRPIQERAAEPILDGEADVLLSAPTAGGKTEAVFLPIASRLAEAKRTGLGCLCVSPLKALIDDQADRLTPLFERVGLPLTPWHGDVAQERKRKLLRDRAGVLLITPESLEALFVRRGSQLPRLFRDLHYVVVDELHSFGGTERGRQLQSLLHRIELAIRRRVPRIALSATLGDMDLAAETLRPGLGAEVVRIEAERDGRELKMQLRGYKTRPPVPSASPGSEARVGGDGRRLTEDLFAALRGEDHLVFANSRRQVEELTDRLRRLSSHRRVPNEFFAHHGSLSREIREEAERNVKDGSRPTSVICTSTLELGIDIGSVASIAQVGSPPAVATLRQRLGRSGRQENVPAVLRLFLVEQELGKTSHLLDALRGQLVQSIAMVELLLARWCEPPIPGQLHLSTLVQQILSTIAQHGGASARDLYRTLCQSGPFREIDSEIFGRLLRCLGERHVLTQMSDGALTLGDGGEKLVDHYSFYAAFATSEEYRLVAGSATLGSMPISQPLEPGSYLIFAGRRWVVRAVDDTARVIELAPAAGGSAPHFDGGGFDVHDRVRSEMRRIYASTAVPVYLDTVAVELLSEGRGEFERWGLSDRSLVEQRDLFYLFPWRGDRALNTLALQLKARGLEAGIEGLAISVRGVEAAELRGALELIARGGGPSGPLLARHASNQIEEKYDWALDPELLRMNYASRRLDESGARRAAKDLIGSPQGGA